MGLAIFINAEILEGKVLKKEDVILCWVLTLVF